MTEFFAGFGLRDWLLIFGPLLIIGILLHGYWRMQVSRNSLKMKLDKSFVSDLKESGDETDELALLRAELPNGGARVLSPTEQTSLNLDDDVPVLMNVAEQQEASEAESSEQDEVTEPELTATQVKQEPEARPAEEEVAQVQAARALPANLPEQYVVINVMAVNAPFKGQELLDLLLEQKMVLGEMNIFHRMSGDQTLFSLMNAVEPGSFDLATMGEVETPAVSMFMRVHELHQPIRVFEQMLHVAASVAEQLGGEVRDESRSVMTTQTIEHCRQQLQDYMLKHHS